MNFGCGAITTVRGLVLIMSLLSLSLLPIDMTKVYRPIFSFERNNDQETNMEKYIDRGTSLLLIMIVVNIDFNFRRMML